jgi:predicted metal-binding membrane protein
MKLAGKTRIESSHVILCISIFVWVLLLMNPGNVLTIKHCPVTGMCPPQSSFRGVLAMNPISALLTGWGLMVIAMMFPKLIFPIRFIYARSLKRRRFGSALLFVFGYVGVWMVVGLFMILAILGLSLIMPKSYLPSIAVGIIALIWQFSPIKQRCLNRGHDHWVLAAFGWAANRDALLFGIMHGVWCVGSGWALMLFPMLLPMGHNFAMIAVTFIMLGEHLEHPKLPRWCLGLRGKLLRIIIYQTQIRLKQVFD